MGRGSSVSWVSFLPIFSLLHPSILDLGSGTDRQTDDSHQRLMPSPYGGGHKNNKTRTNDEMPHILRYLKKPVKSMSEMRRLKPLRLLTFPVCGHIVLLLYGEKKTIIKSYSADLSYRETCTNTDALNVGR